ALLGDAAALPDHPAGRRRRVRRVSLPEGDRSPLLRHSRRGWQGLMNDLQDAICDRLVGSKISRDWVNGPMHVAARVIDPVFVLAEGRYDRRENQLVRTLNWPRLFCLAFHGSSAALSAEDDRRALAIDVFQRVAPGRRQKRLAMSLGREVA